MLRSHKVHFTGRESFVERLQMIDGRYIISFIAIVVVIVVFVMAISQCTSKNAQQVETEASQEEQTQTTDTMSEQDSRVATGISNTLISEFTEQLDQGEKLQQIAAHADQYSDERLLELALREPAAIDFVAAWPDAQKSASAYTDEVSKGSVPKLFDWDERWGAVTYGDGPIAVTGSGPTTLMMAYVGLSGLNNMTAANFATLDASQTQSTESSEENTLINMATSAGLSASLLQVSEDNLTGYLSETSVIAIRLKTNTVTAEDHWALAVGVDTDGSLILFDPTSTSVSDHTWDPATISSYASSFVLLSITDESLAQLQANAQSTSTNSTTSDATSTGATSGTGTSSATSSGSTTGTSGSSGSTTGTTSSSGSTTGATSSSGSTTGTSGTGSVSSTSTNG
ncbi:MAG: hypothetical protein ACOX4F_02925 [Atopobiaceae bacterium]